MAILQKDKTGFELTERMKYDGVVVRMRDFPNVTPLTKIPTYNFTITEASDLYVPIYLIDEEENPISLTGYNVNCKIRKEFESDAVDVLSNDIGRIILNGNTGNIILKFPKHLTSKYPISTLNKRSFSDVSDNTYMYDVFIEKNPTKICILRGYITIIPQVSDS
jgi:bifunctional DNase/RNase